MYILLGESFGTLNTVSVILKPNGDHISQDCLSLHIE